ncbi:SRPBCC family protein [Undibacterium sp. Ji50W]|uniref:SRPBCC family protein n=1 Tax=Undibacterium sp. Ji50W TaxID=3413041 RepID=UPI003BF362FB
MHTDNTNRADNTNDTQTLVVEREMPHALEKIWRALTQGYLIEEWLMKNDFQAVVGHRFKLSADWGVVDCQVLVVEPHQVLSYAWEAMGLKSVVTWTLTATSSGTHLRMEQSGFRPDQQQAYQGAQYGWQKFFANLDRVAGSLS